MERGVLVLALVASAFLPAIPRGACERTGLYLAVLPVGFGVLELEDCGVRICRQFHVIVNGEKGPVERTCTVRDGRDLVMPGP